MIACHFKSITNQINFDGLINPFESTNNELTASIDRGFTSVIDVQKRKKGFVLEKKCQR